MSIPNKVDQSCNFIDKPLHFYRYFGMRLKQAVFFSEKIDGRPVVNCPLKMGQVNNDLEGMCSVFSRSHSF